MKIRPYAIVPSLSLAAMSLALFFWLAGCMPALPLIPTRMPLAVLPTLPATATATATATHMPSPTAAATATPTSTPT
ncbi:MAG: hypothetical protein IAE79_28470, partial [Anaerolinea sp.]|nr:hypothetical protein [Anaerolinea sp.]